MYLGIRPKELNQQGQRLILKETEEKNGSEKNNFPLIPFIVIHLLFKLIYVQF